MLPSRRHASDRVFATGPRADQLQDKPHRPSVTCSVTRAGDEDTSIINVTYPCGSPIRVTQPRYGRRASRRARRQARATRRHIEPIKRRPVQPLISCRPQAMPSPYAWRPGSPRAYRYPRSPVKGHYTFVVTSRSLRLIDKYLLGICAMK